MGNRIFWACQRIEAATARILNDTGSNEFDASANGAAFNLLTAVQSVGINTNLNLENIFQLGQLEVYQEYEEIPEIEVTINRLLNDKQTLYGMMIGNGTIIDNLNAHSALRFTLYEDKTTDDPNPAQSTQYTISPAYLSQITYTFPVDGNFTEEVTVVSNNKVASSTTVPNFTEKEGKILRRGSFGPGSIMPNTVGAKKVQSVSVSINFGREDLRELGKRKPFIKYINLPLEITTTIEVLATESGDGLLAQIGADCDSTRTPATNFETIKIATCDGMVLDLGAKNKLLSTSFSGGDASGGNATITYNYRNFNTLTYTSP
jgi:hypothetical protein